ncbi:MAG: hypothetical protein Q8936_23350 [Bacillota bacterium]|nr:hypothetical protein [Bacillota bacterium]
MRNKRWKRKAKRMFGKSDMFFGDCFFCVLSMTYQGAKENCHGACRGNIRQLEQLCKAK